MKETSTPLNTYESSIQQAEPEKNRTTLHQESKSSIDEFANDATSSEEQHDDVSVSRTDHGSSYEATFPRMKSNDNGRLGDSARESEAANAPNMHAQQLHDFALPSKLKPEPHVPSLSSDQAVDNSSLFESTKDAMATANSFLQANSTTAVITAQSNQPVVNATTYEPSAPIHETKIFVNNTKPIHTDALNRSNGNNSSNNSIGTWQSGDLDKAGKNGHDSDSDIEVWTKPAASAAAASTSAPKLSNSIKSFDPPSYPYSSYQPSMSTLTSNLHNNYPIGLAMIHPLELPPNHVSTWEQIIPSNYFELPQSNIYAAFTRKKIVLSLINVWEFTLEGEVPRAQIKKIAKDHMGKDGRVGALFERVGILLPDDPALKQSNNDNSQTSLAISTGEEGYKGGGKWRIPLGAYHPLMTYLTSLSNTDVEGIPAEQLRAATLGRERFQKGYPSADELVKRGVGKHVAHALAPYQRGGVDFVLERKGKALLADEMGLGKTIQGIAAMSAYWKEWPLLILTPSSARYHWEVEIRQWLSDVDLNDTKKSRAPNSDWDGRRLIAPPKNGGDATINNELKKEAVNVLTSGKCHVLRSDGKTKVVIVSFGLIVSLINSKRITPEMFKCIIVDESHALKNKASKRTQAVLPLLKTASRCILLSGTPALARPSELWPQISVLGDVWVDETGFYTKYVRGDKADENASKARLAELHTLLTSTVMIRRMKADILKNLQPKIREKAYIDIQDESLKNEFHTYMQMLKQGRGVMGKFAREHSTTSAVNEDMQQYHTTSDGEEVSSRAALHHLYKITGKAKIAKVTVMLKRWLADPTLGKLCIFAHHLDVLDEIARGAGLSNLNESMTKFIRIDGATLPKIRQEQILSFQTDPSVRIALLGITAAGVAVTLTASSTIWFTELFWTPAIMIQAEDRCHRIGQQARVRCLYFIARGTLDEILWKLIEKKFRDLGEFVEGRENMDIALERELEDDEDAEILKAADSKKRKAQDDVSDLFDLEHIGGSITEEINDLVHEEEDMLKAKNDEEEDDEDEDNKVTKQISIQNNPKSAQSTAVLSGAPIIELSDEEEGNGEEETIMTVQEMRDFYKRNGVLSGIKLDRTVRFKSVNIYKMQFHGQRYGFNMLYLHGRAIVKEPLNSGTKVGAIIVAVGSHVLRQEPFNDIRARMRDEIMQNYGVSLTFAHDSEFTSLVKEEILTRFAMKQNQKRVQEAKKLAVAKAKPETVNLLDDDDD